MQLRLSILLSSVISVSPLPLFANETQPNPTEQEEISNQESSEWFEDIKENIEFKTTITYRNFLDNQYFEDSVLGLTEARYQGDDFTIDTGLVYRNITDQKLAINHLSYAKEFDTFDYKIGKFVTKVGVMDFLSFIDVFNNTRAEYFDDDNVNVRYNPSWMAQLNTYPDANSTFGLYVKPYDQDSNTLFGDSIQFGLDSVVPFIITNTGKSDLDLIGREVLLPAYGGENGAKSASSDYISEKLPNEDPSLRNTSLFLNYVITEDNYTFGALHTSAYSSLPIFTFDTALIAAVENLPEEDKEAYIADYLDDEGNEPLKLIEYFRYNQFALYYESAVGQFGYRAELSYRDKFPLLYRTTSMVSLGLGVDHQSSFYNNIEFQYSKFSESDLAAYYLVWLARSDEKRIYNWQASIQNMLTYGVYGDYDVWANFSGVQFKKDNFQVSFEYLTHSEKDYLSDTAAIKFKVIL